VTIAAGPVVCVVSMRRGIVRSQYDYRGTGSITHFRKLIPVDPFGIPGVVSASGGTYALVDTRRLIAVDGIRSSACKRFDCRRGGR
jgi:hypothetical protein